MDNVTKLESRALRDLEVSIAEFLYLLGDLEDSLGRPYKEHLLVERKEARIALEKFCNSFKKLLETRPDSKTLLEQLVVLHARVPIVLGKYKRERAQMYRKAAALRTPNNTEHAMGRNFAANDNLVDDPAYFELHKTNIDHVITQLGKLNLALQHFYEQNKN